LDGNGEISFGRFRLDLRRRELSHDGRPVRLRRRSLDILCALASANGELVSKNELIERLWPGRAVEDGNLYFHMSALRAALGGNGDGHSYIVTVPGRGYRLAGLSFKLTGLDRLTSQNLRVTLSDKPSIAVLPFANLGGDPEQEYFINGVVEEILTALSRIRWLSVIARSSSPTYTSRAVDVKQVGCHLGVRYVLEGSVRKVGACVRIAAQLIDATSGAHLWADRFDGSLEDVFELQDRVGASVAGVVEPALQAAEAARSTCRPASDLGAYDCYVRALAVSHPMTKEAIVEALDLLKQAIAIERHYGPALALAAGCHMQSVNYSWAEDPETARRKAVDLARRALQVAGDDADVIASAAMTLAVFGEDIGTMRALADHALALNPSCARGWYHSGFLTLMAGEPDRAIEQAEMSLRLSPRTWSGPVHTMIGASHFLSRRFDEATAKLLLALGVAPNSPVAFRYLAACYASLGRLDEARNVVKRLRAITPAVTPPDIMYLRNAQHRKLYLSGLRLAAGAAA